MSDVNVCPLKGLTTSDQGHVSIDRSLCYHWWLGDYWNIMKYSILLTFSIF